MKYIIIKPSLLIKLEMVECLGCFLQTQKMIELLKDNLVIISPNNLTPIYYIHNVIEGMFKHPFYFDETIIA